MQGSQLFRQFDKDGNGKMSRFEFHRALMQISGFRCTEHEAEVLFYKIDIDRSNNLSEQEFVEFWVVSHGGLPLLQNPVVVAPAPVGYVRLFIFS